MFGRRHRQERNDWEDFMARSNGQNFALFKHLGGKAGADLVLAGLPALTATVPEREVAKTWVTASVKTGYGVIAGFYAAYLAEREKQKGDPSPLNAWRDDVAANSDLDEMEIELCRVEARNLTGFDQSLPRSIFFQLVRHPYHILPAEILAQLPTAFEELPDLEWDTFMEMYAQPTMHDAAGGFNKLMILHGAPKSSFSKRNWNMYAQEWRNVPQGVPIRAGVGTIVADPEIRACDRILVMKVPYKLVVDRS